jgi:hypothetical protein
LSKPLSDENFSAAVDVIFEDTSKLSDEQFESVISTIFDKPLSDEQFAAVLETVFDKPISDEKFESIISAVLEEPLSNEQFEELVNVLESETVTEEQVSASVDLVIENGVTEDQAVGLATSKKVLQSIDSAQATEIFDAVEISAVSPEDAIQLVAAVQDAPQEVRESFEEEINVFDGVIDTYTPLDSAVDVKTRRVLIAATAIATSISISSAPLSPSSPTSPPSPYGGGGTGAPTQENKTSDRRRKI